MPKKQGSRPRPPKGLSEAEKAEWGRICDELAEVGRLERVDRAILTIYVSLWATHQAAARVVAAEGATHEIPGGYRQTTPDYDVMVKTSQQLRATLKEMGVTYGSRPKTPLPQDDDLIF